MQNIRLAVWSVPVGLSLLWLLTALPFPETLTFIAARNLLVQYSGVLTIGAMSVAMILATRSRWLEQLLHGLDKSYRLHKWLGIMALVTAVVHWLSAQAPKWLVSAGLMERGARPTPPEVLPGSIEAFFREQRHLAEGMGDLVFKIAVVLIALALIRRFPYKPFVNTHKLLAASYLVLVFHSVVLLQFDTWLTPIGLVMAALMAGGTAAGLLSLTGQIGRRRRVHGSVESVRHVPEMGVTETTITLEKGWKGHEAGQFAFFTFDKREGHHPFTIASAWDPENPRMTIVSKALGDYTKALPETLKIGAKVAVEGPYGRFAFEGQAPRQIWIAGGIGITPFLARMKELAARPGRDTVDLIHCTKDIAPEVLDKLEAAAKAANVRLHLLIEGRDGLLDPVRLRKLIPDWSSGSVWFCGPKGFGHSMRQGLIRAGLAPRNFHQELFDMR